MLDLTKFEGHTPGPWRCEPTGLDSHHIWAGKALVALLYGSSAMQASETQANAYLLYAAPDLLAEAKRLREALLTIRDAINSEHPMEWSDESVEAVLDLCKVAEGGAL